MVSARGFLLIASSIFALAGCQGVELPDMKVLNPLQALEAKAGEEGAPSAPEQAGALPSLAARLDLASGLRGRPAARLPPAAPGAAEARDGAKGAEA